MRMSAGGGGSLGIESASSLKALLLQQLKHHGGFIPHDNASTGGGDNLSEGGETSDSDCSTAAHSIGRRKHSGTIPNRCWKRSRPRTPMDTSVIADTRYKCSRFALRNA